MASQLTYPTPPHSTPFIVTPLPNLPCLLSQLSPSYLDIIYCLCCYSHTKPLIHCHHFLYPFMIYLLRLLYSSFPLHVLVIVVLHSTYSSYTHNRVGRIILFLYPFYLPPHPLLPIITLQSRFYLLNLHISHFYPCYYLFIIIFFNNKGGS